MIKKLDLLLLRNFIGPFIVTFFVALFVLVMQFLFVYMDDLIGKGLDTWILIKLLVLMSTSMVPMALPLAVLLSSIMTLGSMGERFELVAIKSSGISLFRFLRPLLLFILLISFGAFLFSNYVIPVANLKAFSMLYDVRNAKPALNIKAGQFYNEINGYSIRVGNKEKDGRTIHDVLIYDNLSSLHNSQIVASKKGEMLPTADKKFLIFRLQDGWRYQDGATHNPADKNEQVRMHFERWDKVFDLANFKMARTSEESFKSGQQFMNIRQIDKRLDTINDRKATMAKNMSSYLSPYFSYVARDGDTLKQAVLKAKDLPVVAYKESVMELFPDSIRLRVHESATSNVRNASNMTSISTADEFIQKQQGESFLIEWHRKFTIAFACLVLFLIGAPLGAIIRKGGIGLPLIFAIVFFVVYHILSRTGEQYIKGGKLDVFMGMWLSTFILIPIAGVMLITAKNDAAIFTKEMYTRYWNKLIGFISGLKTRSQSS